MYLRNSDKNVVFVTKWFRMISLKALTSKTMTKMFKNPSIIFFIVATGYNAYEVAAETTS